MVDRSFMATDEDLSAPLMPPGLLDAPAPVDPRITANRQQGIATGRLPPVPAQTAQKPPINSNMINQVYGLLAQNAEDPTRVGMNYVTAMQQQAEAQRRNTPIEKFLQIYGKVNPYDWTAESLQEFHTNFIKTGQMQFDMLKQKQGLSEADKKQIYAADTAMQEASNSIRETGNLISGFDAAIAQGGYSTGLYGTIDEWFAKNITGDIKKSDALKTDFKRIINTGVLKNLPPGVASDRDIAIAREGFPGASSDPTYLAAYVRGMRKLAVVDYARQKHRSYYLSAALTPAGLSADWLKTGDRAVDIALREHGMALYIPQGGNMTNAQAARQWYASGRRGVGDNTTPQALPAGSNAPVNVETADERPSKAQVDEILKRNRGG